MKRIADLEEDMGTLEFDQIPEEKDLQPKDDGAGTTYAGEKNAKGEKEGFGIANYANGSLYFGLWKAGKAHGKGWFFHDDGDVYKGDWAEGQQNGEGVY